MHHVAQQKRTELPSLTIGDGQVVVAQQTEMSARTMFSVAGKLEAAGCSIPSLGSISPPIFPPLTNTPAPNFPSCGTYCIRKLIGHHGDGEISRGRARVEYPNCVSSD